MKQSKTDVNNGQPSYAPHVLTTEELAKLDVKVYGVYRAQIPGQLADEWFRAYNPPERNRNITIKKTSTLAEELLLGKWQFNGDAIRFSDSGILLDGQKRLLACHLTGVPLDTLIVTGLPEASMEAIDLGETRSVAQIIGFRQGKDITTSHDRWRQSIATALAVWDRFSPCDFMAGSGMSMYALTSSMIEETYFQAKEEIDAVIPMIVHMQREGLLPPKACGTLRLLFGRVEQEAAETFFDKLITGANLEEGDPILVLSKILRKSKSQAVMSKRVHDSDKVFLTIKAWNFWRKGKKCEHLVRMPREDWPEIFGLDNTPKTTVQSISTVRTGVRKYLACLKKTDPSPSVQQ